jgi:hypothetical protein
MKVSGSALLAIAAALSLGCMYLFHKLSVEVDKTEVYRSSLQYLEGRRHSAGSSVVLAGASAAGNFSSDTLNDSPPEESPDRDVEQEATISEDKYSGTETGLAGGFAAYERQRRGVLMLYGDLIAELKLSRSQMEEFVRLMIELRQKPEALRSSISSPREYANAAENTQREINSQIISQLGESGFTAYTEYQKTLPFRNDVNMLTLKTAAIGAPLEDRQRRQLLAAMLEEGKSMPSWSGNALLYELHALPGALRRFRSELNAQRLHDLQHHFKARVSFGSKRFIKPIAGKARILGKLNHALGTGNVTQRCGDECRIVAGFLQACGQVCGHVLLVFEVVRHIEAGKFRLFGLGCHV